MGSVSVVFVFLGDALRHDAAALVRLVRQGESETAKRATFQGHSRPPGAAALAGRSKAFSLRVI